MTSQDLQSCKDQSDIDALLGDDGDDDYDDNDDVDGDGDDDDDAQDLCLYLHGACRGGCRVGRRRCWKGELTLGLVGGRVMVIMVIKVIMVVIVVDS